MTLRSGIRRQMRPSRLAVLAALVVLAPGLQAQPGKRWRVAAERSTFQVELGKSGWLRIFGDEHVIAVTEYEAQLEFDPAKPTAGKVELVIPARALRVRDTHLTADDRLKIQEKMEGPEVLDLAHFGEIRFVSRQVTAGEGDVYRVRGDLTIRGSPRETSFNLTLTKEGDGYRGRGEALVKMTPYGIEPPSAGGGGIKVKDEMKIVFDLLLLPMNN